MLSTEVLHALHAYTSLPAPVQGILERQGTEFEFGAGLTRDKDFQRALAAIDVDVFCVKSLRILSDPAASATVVQGSFVLRGKVAVLDKRIITVASVVAGEVPKELRRDNYLLELKEEDVTTCSSPQQVPFGVNVATDSLAPRWNYVSSVFTRKVPRVVIACPNGLFTIHASPASPSRLSPEQAKSLLQNLVEADLLVQIDSPRPKIIYRVSRNCLLVGDERARSVVSGLQTQLQLPSLTAEARTLPTSIAGFSLDAGLLVTNGPRVDEDALRKACPPGAVVARQPLNDWWHPPNALACKIRLSGQQDSAAELPLSLNLKLPSTDARPFETHLHLQAPALRDLRPGETAAMLVEQLRQLSATALHAATTKVGSGLTQQKLDELTTELGQYLEKSVRDSLLFSQEITVYVSAKFEQVLGGLPVSLPSGDLVSVPAYSFKADSPRLNAYLGVYSLLGMQGSFRSWEHAFKNKILLS